MTVSMRLLVGLLVGVNLLLIRLALWWFLHRSTTPLWWPFHRPSTQSDLKVYVYNIPEKLLQAGYQLDYDNCPNYFYSIEIGLPAMLQASKWSLKASQVKEASQADYFLVPHYSACYFHHCKTNSTHEDCYRRTAEYMSAILDHVEGEYPFWVRKQGRDHLFVFSWDWGVHLFGDKSESVIRNRVASSVQLTLLGLSKKDPREVFDPHKDISIPPLGEYRHVAKLPRPTDRTIFAYFRGTITREWEYSRGVRPRILQYGEEDPANYFVRTQHSGFYWHELVNARYALCPLGWSHWSPRLFDAVVAGAIPVIIADEWEVAFNGTLIDWTECSVRVAQKDIDRLTQILKAIPKEREERMRAKLQQVAQRITWHEQPIKDDALDSVMQILASRPKPQTTPPIIFHYQDVSEGEYTHSEDQVDDDIDSVNDEL